MHACLLTLLFSSESSHTSGLSFNDLLKEAATIARAQLEKEQNNIEQSLSAIVDVQVPALEVWMLTTL
jgi:hypothetical protein